MENIGTMTPYAVYKGEEVIIEFDDDENMRFAIQKIYAFMEDVALREMNMYSNTKFLDNTINGKNYWELNDIRFHKYLFMPNQIMDRLIIAYLCRNPRFEVLFEMIKEYFFKGFEEFQQEDKEYHLPRHFYEGRSRLDYLYDILKETLPLQLD
jgi:hypothetical protein